MNEKCNYCNETETNRDTVVVIDKLLSDKPYQYLCLSCYCLMNILIHNCTNRIYNRNCFELHKLQKLPNSITITSL